MQPITITDAAIEHLKNMLAKEKNGLGFRLSIKKTGCSGYAYVPEIIKTLTTTDLHFVTKDLPVYIDTNCLTFIKDLTIDYVEDGALGLKTKRLVFINPQEKNRCGCGESFTVD